MGTLITGWRATFLVLPLCSFLLFVLHCRSHAQTIPDPALVEEISRIKAIDNHAHPLRMMKEGETDREWHPQGSRGDEVVKDEPTPTPLRLRPPTPLYPAAWRALYGYQHSDMSKEHVHELAESKRSAMREQGDSYPSWVLDKMGIEIMLANRVVMGSSLQTPRFRWVSYIDALMFPLNNRKAKESNQDRRGSFLGEEEVLKRCLADLQLKALPPTLDEYLTKVVTPALERQKRDGAVAVKSLAAYLRTLDFAEAPADRAKEIYARYVNGDEPPSDEYKVLQDYLFRAIAREAGRLGLVVHIHTGFGIGAYFDVAAANPLLLEPVFNDPSLRKTTFVLLHGGWPFARQTAAMLLTPNVYADFSSLGFLIYERELSDVIRSWLEIAPEKVMFGTDAFEVDPKIFVVNWEEFGWIGATGGRQALSLALTSMMNDGGITRERAVELARMVLRDNAIRLYRFEAR